MRSVVRTAEIERLKNVWNRPWLEKDEAAVEGLMATDYTYLMVAVHGNGRVETGRRRRQGVVSRTLAILREDESGARLVARSIGVIRDPAAG